uniref:Glycosyl transferase 64 domain-containing protein n=1 Tax=Ananas comosus var. bracteatus TaxID=296719 RepID=A0A6V7NTZ0_ANACO|nr:unnamed protein product [Ananas comosus var. bracteatus]
MAPASPSTAAPTGPSTPASSPAAPSAPAPSPCATTTSPSPRAPSPLPSPLPLPLPLRPAQPLVGFFGRAHYLDPARREWVYGARRDRYSILLAKFLLLPASLLRRYSITPLMV